MPFVKLKACAGGFTWEAGASVGDGGMEGVGGLGARVVTVAIGVSVGIGVGVGFVVTGTVAIAVAGVGVGLSTDVGEFSGAAVAVIVGVVLGFVCREETGFEEVKFSPPAGIGQRRLLPFTTLKLYNNELIAMTIIIKLILKRIPFGLFLILAID